MRRLLEKPHFRSWLAIVGASTLVLGAGYAMAQQSARLTADQAPLVAAQQTKQLLENGKTANDSIPNNQVNLASDAAVFVTVTDSNRHILASNAKLGDRVPLPPLGVFSFTTTNSSDSFTWQPQAGVRLATRVLAYKTADGTSGFVVTGQSLQSAENQIDVFGKLALSAWIAVVAWVTLIYFFAGRWAENKSPRKK